MSRAVVHLARLFAVDAAPGTTWLFVETQLDDGTSGWGEASLGRDVAGVTHAAARLLPLLRGIDARPSLALQQRLPMATLAQAAVSSALMQALWDADAQRAGVALVDRLDVRRRDVVGLYANINRRTRDRSPEGMAASALDARTAGFEAIKIAPFDEVQPTLSRDAQREAMVPGLARIAAVREAIGPSARLMVDCHWRFDAAVAADMLRAAAESMPYWIECPIAETPDTIDAIVRLRSLANELGVRLAGLETTRGVAGFMPYLDAGAYDVMMPDVKYAGGPDEMLRIARVFDRYGVDFSPHNPTGPVCHAHSLHLCAALGESDLLEHQFDETPVFDALVAAALPPARDGIVAPDWQRPGLGVAPAGDASMRRLPLPTRTEPDP